MVIFELGHFCNTSADDEGLLNLINNTLGDKVFKQEASNNNSSFLNLQLANVLDPNNSTGKIILLYDGVSNSGALRAQGIFSHSFISRAGSYANAQNFDDMKSDQLSKYLNFNQGSNSILSFSWTLTMDTELAVSCALNPSAKTIADMANQANSPIKVFSYRLDQ